MAFSLTRLMACSAALTAALVLAPAPADAFEQGDFHAGLYTAPGQLFTVKSPLGPESYLVDGFDRSAGAVTFLDNDGELFGVICTPSYDVLAGANNDFETDAAILRNWFHQASVPHFFEKQIPGAWIVSEAPGEFEGKPAWIAVLYLPRGSAKIGKDPATGDPARSDSWRGVVVFSRGEHTYLIMTETPPAPVGNSFLVNLSEFYRGFTFTEAAPASSRVRIYGVENAGTDD
jgi:hypothetical protein